MSLLKPSKAKIGTTLMFIIFIFLNSAIQSIPKEIYKEEVKKYYSLKDASPETIKSREKYLTETYAQLKTPSASETERLMNLGYLNITIQFLITLILAYFFACLIHRARPAAYA